MANDYYRQFGGTCSDFLTKQQIGMARPTNYLVDGSGRDNYIANNNGGLYVAHKPASSLSSGVFRTPQRPSSSLCNLGVKRSHYHCDGTGRDRYVLKSDIPTFSYS